MASMTLDTAGESHGKGCFALVQGFPAGLTVDASVINRDLKRRQGGYGRGARQKIEQDQVEFLSGVLHGVTMGSPVLMAVWNKDFKIERMPDLVAPRPGHADLTGALKYDAPIRYILERSSARETAARVAAGGLARCLLSTFGIQVRSHVLRIGPVALPDSVPAGFDAMAAADESDVRCLDAKTADAMRKAIDQAKFDGDTLGGVYEVMVEGLPAGLGSHAQWHAKLDARLAQAVMSIQAHKGVEIGAGFRAGEWPGSKVHDDIHFAEGKHARSGGFYRTSNGHGGTEGGMSTGAPLLLRAVMKPIPTMMKPKQSVDLVTRKPHKASVERSDVCTVPAASVVGEAVVCFTLAQALLDKFGSDSISEMQDNWAAYERRMARPRKADALSQGADAVSVGRSDDTMDTNAYRGSTGAEAAGGVRVKNKPGAGGKSSKAGGKAKAGNSGPVRMATDGGCRGNPGIGAWSVLLTGADGRRLKGGVEAKTTNNRMELTAVIRGLESVAEGADVSIRIDSEYVRKGATEWMAKWKRNRWQTSARKPVQNQDLWMTLDGLLASRKVKWSWVKGHSGDVENETCDLALNVLMDAYHARRIDAGDHLDTTLKKKGIPDPDEIEEAIG